MAIAESITREVDAIAASEGIARVVRLTLVIGELSGVDKESLSFALPFAAEGTVLAGTEFVFEDEPAVVECSKCGARSAAEFPLVACPACGAGNVEIVWGGGLEIKSMEFENV